jgi:hypothetical protein
MPKHYSNKKEKSGSYYGAGHGDFANMPTEVKQMAYPVPYSGLETDYPDTIMEIDKDLSDSYKKAAHYPSDSMY